MNRKVEIDVRVEWTGVGVVQLTSRISPGGTLQTAAVVIRRVKNLPVSETSTENMLSRVQ